MSRKRKSLPILENVEIESVAAEGKCVAHVNDMVVFVPFVVPGDIVDLQVRKKRHSYCEATVLRMIRIELGCIILSTVLSVLLLNANILESVVGVNGKTFLIKNSWFPNNNKFSTN